jgi:hypothetical protein
MTGTPSASENRLHDETNMTRTVLRSANSAWHIRLYAGIWAGYFGLLLALPIRYSRLEAFTATLSLIGWAALSLLCASLTHGWLARRGFALAQIRASDARRAVTQREVRIVVMASLAIGLIGFACLVIDRVFIQHIDYSQGIAVARELWRKAGEEREGVSSPLSVLGYLFGFSFFVATTIAQLHWEHLRISDRRLVLILASFLIAGNSLLTGGRSIVLIQLAVTAAVGTLRRAIGLSFMPGRPLRIIVGAVVTITVVLSYSLYVFSERAAVGDTLPAIYTEGMVEHLGGQTTDEFGELERLPPIIGSIGQFGTLAGAYLTHSFGTFESALEFEQRSGSVSFAFLRQLLYKAGLLRQGDEGWPLEGRFMPLPGALWYDFGWMGFLLGAAVVGALVGGAPALAGLFGGGIFAIGMSEFALLTGFLAPLLLSMDILSVPFMILGFLQLDVIARFAGGRRYWLAAGRSVNIRAVPK